MRVPILIRLLLVLLIVIIGGCSSKKDRACETDVEYLASGSIEELKVPADLDTPESRERLIVPPQAEAEQSADKTPPCLARPPDYFGD